MSVGCSSEFVEGFDDGVVELWAELLDCLIGAVGPSAIGEKCD